MENYEVGDVVWVDQELIGEVMYVNLSNPHRIRYMVQLFQNFDDKTPVRECFEHQLSEFKPVLTEELPF